MKTIDQIQDEVVDEFSAFDDWMDKYALLIELGNSLSPLDEQFKVESNLIEGCQSRVWLHAEYRDGKVLYQAESDAVIVKGIVSLLIKVLSGSYSAGDSRYTPLFHRTDRAYRTFVAYPFERLACHGEADAALRNGVQGTRGRTEKIV